MRGQLYSSRRSHQTPSRHTECAHALDARGPQTDRHAKHSRLGPFVVNGIPAANTPSCCVAHPGHSSTHHKARGMPHVRLPEKVQLSDGRSESICISAGLGKCIHVHQRVCVRQWKPPCLAAATQPPLWRGMPPCASLVVGCNPVHPFLGMPPCASPVSWGCRPVHPRVGCRPVHPSPLSSVEAAFVFLCRALSPKALARPDAVTAHLT